MTEGLGLALQKTGLDPSMRIGTIINSLLIALHVMPDTSTVIFGLGKDWVMPEPHHSVKIPTSESRVDEVPQRDADVRMAMSSSDDAYLPDLDQHVHVVHNFDGVLPQSLDELLTSSEIPPTPVARYSSSPTRLSRE